MNNIPNIATRSSPKIETPRVGSDHYNNNRSNESAKEFLTLLQNDTPSDQDNKIYSALREYERTGASGSVTIDVTVGNEARELILTQTATDVEMQLLGGADEEYGILPNATFEKLKVQLGSHWPLDINEFSANPRNVIDKLLALKTLDIIRIAHE